MHHLLTLILNVHYPPKGSLFNWLFGPQVLGLVFLIIGAVQYKYPPKKINDWYGYRSDNAKRNQFTWAEAQHYSALLMIKTGLYVIVLGFLITTALNFLPLSPQLHMALVLLFYIAGAMAPALLMIVKTEKHLATKFGEK